MLGSHVGRRYVKCVIERLATLVLLLLLRLGTAVQCVPVRALLPSLRWRLERVVVQIYRFGHERLCLLPRGLYRLGLEAISPLVVGNFCDLDGRDCASLLQVVADPVVHALNHVVDDGRVVGARRGAPALAAFKTLATGRLRPARVVCGASAVGVVPDPEVERLVLAKLRDAVQVRCLLADARDPLRERLDVLLLKGVNLLIRTAGVQVVVAALRSD